MGLLFSCDKCTPSGTESVITFSDKLIDRLTFGGTTVDDEEPESGLIEINWIERLKCIDDSHSKAYGLTTDGFNSLIRKLEMKFKSLDERDAVCAREQMLTCFGNYPDNPLKCTRQSQEFITCTDAARLRKMKEKLDELQQGNKH